MELKKVKNEGLYFEYHVSFSRNEVSEEERKIAEERAKTYKKQGYRPGHVPVSVVLADHKGEINRQAIQNIINKANDAVVTDSKVDAVASVPKLEILHNGNNDTDMAVSISFSGIPPFEIQPYEFKISMVVPNVEENEIDDKLSDIVKKAPVYEKADKEYCAQALDTVYFSAICYKDNVEHKKRNFENSLIIPETVPEEDQLISQFIGKKIGDEFSYKTSDKNGFTYTIKINSINRALTDISAEDYAKRKGLKDISELRSIIKKQIENEINATTYLYHKNQIIEQLVEQYRFDIPEEVFKREMTGMLYRYKQQLKQEMKESSSDKKMDEKTDEQLKEELKDIVEKRCILGYVLNKIAQKEQIVVTNQDISVALMEELAKNPSLHEKDVIDFYKKNPAALDYKKAEILEYKVIKFLLSQAETTEIKKTLAEAKKLLEELMSEDED